MVMFKLGETFSRLLSGRKHFWPTHPYRKFYIMM
jgi:hypothetical protein